MDHNPDTTGERWSIPEGVGAAAREDHDVVPERVWTALVRCRACGWPQHASGPCGTRLRDVHCKECGALGALDVDQSATEAA